MGHIASSRQCYLLKATAGVVLMPCVYSGRRAETQKWRHEPHSVSANLNYRHQIDGRLETISLCYQAQLLMPFLAYLEQKWDKREKIILCLSFPLLAEISRLACSKNTQSCYFRASRRAHLYVVYLRALCGARIRKS